MIGNGNNRKISKSQSGLNNVFGVLPLRPASTGYRFGLLSKKNDMQRFSIAILLVLFFFACGREEPAGAQEFEEIEAEGSITNSDIVRNPVTAQGPVDTVNVARIEFEEPTFDFGEVQEGEVVSRTFRFRNTGRVPLLISDARSTCGCTVPNWPRTPIEPGGTGEVTVRFNTEGRTGRQSKPVSISANTYPATTEIHINGYVIPQGEEATEAG